MNIIYAQSVRKNGKFEGFVKGVDKQEIKEKAKLIDVVPYGKLF